MALKKVRGFNRGKSFMDLMNIAGTSNVPSAIYSGTGYTMMPAKGARWDTVNGGTVQRLGTSVASTSYPGHTNNTTTNTYLEDFGPLSDYYSAGGFCVTAYAALLNPNWGLIYSPDGVVARCLTNINAYYDSTDFYTPTGSQVPVPGAPSSTLPNTLNTRVKVADTGELLITNQTYTVLWDSATTPTVSAATSTSGSYYSYQTYHDGFYYHGIQTTSNTNGAIRRSDTWNGTYTSVATVGGVITKVDWVPGANCFISTATTTAAGIPTILRSTDGATWTTVFTGTAVAGPRDFASNAPGSIIVVAGQNGSIISSTDSGLTWATRASGTTEMLTTVEYFNGEFVVISSLGNTLTSTDGLSWKYAPNNAYGYNLDATTPVWRTVTLGGKLYAYRLILNDRYFVMQYAGGGQWNPIMGLNRTNGASTTAVVPTGTFFADPYAGANVLTNGRVMYAVNMTTSGIWAYASGTTTVWSARSAITTAADNLWHKIQVTGTSVPGQATPTFLMQLIIDDVSYPGSSALPAGAGQHLWFCTSGLGFNAFSDIVVTDFTGVRFAGRPLTDLQLRPRSLTTDVGTPQWMKVPDTLSTNVLAAQGDGSVVSASTYVQSSELNDVDTYQGGSITRPSGYRIAALSAEADFQRLGVPIPTVSLGFVDQGTALPAASATLTSTVTYAPLSVLSTSDHNGADWTETTATQTQVQIKRTA